MQGFNTEAMQTIELVISWTTELQVLGALATDQRAGESHFRTDFPNRDDENC